MRFTSDGEWIDTVQRAATIENHVYTLFPKECAERVFVYMCITIVLVTWIGCN